MSELCMNCFNVKGQYEVCPYCGYMEGTPPKQPHHLMPGTVLGNHFIVGTVIGSGGFGITYKCFDMTLGVIVAVKEFYPVGLVNRAPGERRVGLLSGEKQTQYNAQLKRFLTEARSIAQFGKANDIVNVFDFFEENGTAYIIMEYIDGVLLEDYLKKQGSMHPDVAVSVTLKIIEAVKKIHSKGIIHRDVSPDNIFITDENSIKIFDFGASILNDGSDSSEGEEIIKMGYSAPEQYRAKSRQGFYTDVYSAGAIMYHMLTGIKPLESTEREHKDQLKSPMELGVKIGSNIDRAVMEAMAVKPELRFQGIQQFEDALRNKRAAEYPKVKLRKKRQKRNWIVGTSIALILAVIVGVGLYSTVLKPESEIFDSSIRESTTIQVWVENESQQEIVKNIAEEGFKQGNLNLNQQQNPEKWQKFWNENAVVKVDVSVHPNMQEDLQQAGEENLPNMYITDHVEETEKDNLISLEGVYNDINTEDYAYMSEYTTYFPTYKEMPTGLDTLLLYVGEIGYDSENGLEDGKSAIFELDEEEQAAMEASNGSGQAVSDEERMTVELEDVLVGDRDAHENEDATKLSNKFASFDEDAIGYAILLDEKKEWENYFALDDSFVPNVNTLQKIQAFNKTAKQEKYKVGRNKDESVEEGYEIYGNNIVAGAAFRHDVDAAVDLNDSTDLTNRLESYDTYVVTKNGKMLVEYSERYGITKESDVNQEIACKRLLYVMLQAPAQKQKNTYSGETVFPIRIEQLKEFAPIKASMEEFSILFDRKYPCEITGSYSGNMSRFIDELGVSVTEKQELQDYCATYIQNAQAE